MNISKLALVLLTAVSVSSTFSAPPIMVLTSATPRFIGIDSESCTAFLTESLPEGLVYPSSAPSFISTALAWDMLLHNAQRNVSIASFYWSMLREDVYNSSSAYQVSTGLSTARHCISVVAMSECTWETVICTLLSYLLPASHICAAPIFLS